MPLRRRNERVLQCGLVAALLTLGTVAGGCGTSASSLCDEFCDCEGCSDNERDECVDDIEDAERTAENEGCEDQWADYIDCLDSEIECRDGDVDADGCDAEADDLGDCVGGSVVVGGGSNACNAAATLCGGTPSDAACEGTTRCQAQCIVSAGNCNLDAATVDCISGC